MMNTESINDAEDESARRNLTAQMRQHLPGLIAAVKSQWCDYRLAPDHDRINAMRGEVQLLVYWLARQVAMRSRFTYRDEEGRPQIAAMGTFGSVQITELQHALWADVLSKKTVTQLVDETHTDLEAMLTRMLIRAKIDRYRRYRVASRAVTTVEDIFPVNEGGNQANLDVLADEDVVHKSAEEVYAAIQCLQRFEAFLAAEKLNPKLESVAWAIWMAAPLSSKHAGDTSDNKANQDAGLAEELGLPKKTFERYKYMASGLVKRFLDGEGFDR